MYSKLHHLQTLQCKDGHFEIGHSITVDEKRITRKKNCINAYTE